MDPNSKQNTAGVIGRNIAFNWIGFLAHAAIVFFLTPFVLHQLGDVRYGVWALVMAITGYYGLVDLGLRSGVTQYLTRHLARGDLDGVNRSASTGFFLLSTCGLLICGASIVLAAVAPAWLDPPEDVRRELAICIVIVGAGTASQFFLFPFSAVFVATQRYDLSNCIGIATRTIAAAAVWFALSLGAGLVALSAINAVGNLLDYLIRWKVSRLLLPGMRIRWRYAERTVCRQMFSYSAWAFLAQSTTRIAQSSGAVIVGATMPLAAVGKYGLAITIVSFFQNFLGPAARVFFPVATHLDATGQDSRLRRVYAEGTRGMLLLIVVLVFVATLLADPFFLLWVGRRASNDVVGPFRILLFAAALSASQFLGTQVLLGRRAVATLAGLSSTYTALYLVLAIAWTSQYGLLGIATAAAVSAALLQLLAAPYYCCRSLNTSFCNYAISAYGRPLVLTALLWLVYLERAAFLPDSNTWGELIGVASIATVLAATLALLVGLTRAEKGLLISWIAGGSPGSHRPLPTSPAPPATCASGRPRPAVSIGLPVYNGEQYLEETIHSLLRQTYDDFELILSNNGSTDRTEAICRQFADQDSRVRYLHHSTNRGAAWNYNYVFTQSQGRYFKWAADDDAYEPTFLEQCVAALERDRSTVLAFCAARFIDENGDPVDAHARRLPVDSPDVRKRFLPLVGAEHLITEVFGVIRRDVLTKTSLIGSYVGSDRVLLGQLALHGPFARISDPLFLHREHRRRSTYACTTASSQAAWFDPALRNKAVFWRWRHLRENLASINASPQPFQTKVSLWARLLWQAVRRGDKLAGELAAGLATGSGSSDGKAASPRTWWRWPSLVALWSICRCYTGIRTARACLVPRRR